MTTEQTRPKVRTRQDAAARVQIAATLEETDQSLLGHTGDPCKCGGVGPAREHRISILLELVSATHGTTLDTLAQWVDDRAASLEKLAGPHTRGTRGHVLAGQVRTARAIADGVGDVARGTAQRLNSEGRAK